MTSPPPTKLNVRGAAAYASELSGKRVSERTIYFAMEQGYIHYTWIGERTRYTTPAAVRKWVENPDYHTPKRKEKVAHNRK